MNKPYRLHLVGNAHIDPVWLWRWTQGFAEIRATFRSALDRMEEFPGYVFTAAAASYYEWIERQDPAMFEEIRERVAEGRWILAGGMWVQPDCNAPAGESFARQLLVSQRYFQSRFGRMAEIGYNVDSFGHCAQFPQLLAQAGMRGYVFLRPQEHEKHLPPDAFVWRGLDGTQLPAYRILGAYCVGSPETMEKRVEEVAALARQTGRPQMVFYGVGNHGGGPTIRQLRRLEEMRLEPPADSELVHSSPGSYFAELDESKDLPVVEGDLLHHASGCYTANSEAKLQNRLCEQRLLAAERLSCAALILTGRPARAETLSQAWRNVLFNQFHDILGGCSIREAYEDAQELWGEASAAANREANAAFQSVAARIDTSKDGVARLSKETDGISWEMSGLGAPLVVINPHCHAVRTLVTVYGRFGSIVEDEGTAVPVQLIRASRTNGKSDTHDTAFLADLPALGYKTYWCHRQGGELLKTGHDLQSGDSIQNEFYTIKPSVTGAGMDIIDRTTGNTLLTGAGAGLLIDETHCDTWAHNIFSFRNVAGRFENTTCCVSENGPVRARLHIESRCGASTLRQDFTLCAGTAEVSCDAVIDLREDHRMFKLSFPLPGMTHAAGETPFGHMERPLDGVEYPIHSWAAGWGETGAAVLADRTGSFDAAEGELRLTVLRSAIYADHYGVRSGDERYMERGERDFRFVIVPLSAGASYGGAKAPSGCCSPDPASLTRRAALLLQPVRPLMESYHKGTLPRRASLIDASHSGVAVTAIKPSEDGNGFVLRACEVRGERTECVLTFAGRSICAQFSPYQVRTWLLPADGGAAVALDILERPV